MIVKLDTHNQKQSQTIRNARTTNPQETTPEKEKYGMLKNQNKTASPEKRTKSTTNQKQHTKNNLKQLTHGKAQIFAHE